MAFSASQPSDLGPVSSATPIQFPKVRFNHGDGYNATSSVFTAPVSGIYWLSASVKPYPGSGAEIKIRKYGTNLVACSGVDPSTATCVITEYLVQGESVHVVLETALGGHIRCFDNIPFCVFSGHLVQPMMP